VNDENQRGSDPERERRSRLEIPKQAIKEFALRSQRGFENCGRSRRSWEKKLRNKSPFVRKGGVLHIIICHQSEGHGSINFSPTGGGKRGKGLLP